MVEGVHGELDEPVGQTSCSRAIIAGTGASAQRSEGDPERRSAHRVEQATNDHPPVLAAGELEPPALDRVDMLGEHGGGIGGVAGVVAVVEEAAHRMLESLLEKRTLLEGTGRPLDRPLGPGQQGEVAEADPPLLQGGDTRRQPLNLLAGRHRAARSLSGHPALMTDPVDR